MAVTETISPVVTLEPEAKAVVVSALEAEGDTANMALWLEVSGVKAGAYAYDLYFQALSDAGEGDVVTNDGDLQIVIPAPSVEALRGARLEWSKDGEGGLVLINPNSPAPELTGIPEAVAKAGLDGTLARRVSAVLEASINPSIASHGGRADLVAMDETGGIAYLQLSGGCQGCAMSRMTLSQGIETTLREEVPEITAVVDVTDHGGGENPYF